MHALASRAAALVLLLVVVGTASAQARYTWVGGTSGPREWTDASNWSPSGVPAAADTAIVGADGQGQRLAILTVNTTVAGLEVRGQGTVGGNFDLTVTERFLWSAGGAGLETFNGTGTITNASTSTLHMTEPTARFEMGAGRILVNDGTIEWDGPGRWNGQGRLVNNGEMRLSMGPSDPFGFIFGSLPDALTNSASGVIRRDGTGAALLQSGFVNNGMIRVEAGTLQLGGFNSNGARGTGSLEIGVGAELSVSGGVHLQRSLTGASLVLSSNPRVEVSDAYDVTTTRITGGSLQIDADGETETLHLEGGAVNGSGDLAVTGSLDWTGGTMGGSGTTTLGPAIPLSIGGGTVRLNDTRTLRVEGATTWTGDADLSAGSSTTIFENAGALTSTGPGERVTNFVTFRNTGTVVHDGGALRFQSPMENDGEVRIEDGLLSFNSTGTDTGRYEIAETGRMEFIFGTRTLTESVEMVGSGAVAFLGGTVLNRGVWRPGASPGILTIDSDWPAPAPEAVLAVEIGGLAPGTEHDQFAVTGTASLGGTLRVTYTDGFTPTLGQRFLLVAAAGGASGAFDALDLPAAPEAYVETSAIGAELVVGTPVADDPDTARPTALALHAPAPNPARGATRLAYDLPQAGAVRLAVFDALGREAAVLVDADRSAGTHTVSLDAAAFPGGLYLVRLHASGARLVRALTLVR